MTGSATALVKRALPRPLFRTLKYGWHSWAIWRSGLYDLLRFARVSSAVHYDDDEQKLRARITAAYHNIEKGLSLSAPRPGFGIANIEMLVKYLDEAIRAYGVKPYMVTPVSVLGAYVAFNEAQGTAVPYVAREFERLSARLQAVQDPTCFGGTTAVTRDQIAQAVAGVGREFFERRHSCRQFSSEPLTQEEISFAVAAAQKAPVVCNRQSGRVRAYTEKGDIGQILALQGGARGFLSEVTALFCVTVDLRNFMGAAERYQGWIDGGLFAMSFLFGLHAQGLGACCLNWSREAEGDKAMRRLLNLPDHETIIMFVAAGHLPDQFRVARSVRKPIAEVLEFAKLSPGHSGTGS